MTSEHTAEQIIGHDAYMQLVFEGYAVTRAAPDVPELVRYRAGIHSRGYEDENGEYVRHDQAVEQLLISKNLSALQSETIALLDKDVSDLRNRAEAAEAKLALIEKQEPVAIRYRFITTRPPQREWSDWFIVDDGQSVPQRDQDQQEVQHLYTAPVASDAELRAETIEQCRKAVRNAILRMPPEHRANGDICDDVVAHALAALNPSEPRT